MASPGKLPALQLDALSYRELQRKAGELGLRKTGCAVAAVPGPGAHRCHRLASVASPIVSI